MQARPETPPPAPAPAPRALQAPAPFYRWLADEGAHPIWGDLARAALDDPEWPHHARSLAVLERYLALYPTVNQRDREALQRAWQAFSSDARQRRAVSDRDHQRARGRALAAAARDLDDPRVPHLVDAAVVGDASAARTLARLAWSHNLRPLLTQAAEWAARAGDAAFARRVAAWLTERGASLRARQGHAEGSVADLLYDLNSRPLWLVAPLRVRLTWDPRRRARCALALATLACARCPEQGAAARRALDEAHDRITRGTPVPAGALLSAHAINPRGRGGTPSAHVYWATRRALELAEDDRHAPGLVAAEALWAHHPSWWHVDTPDPRSLFGEALTLSEVHAAMCARVQTLLLDD